MSSSETPVYIEEVFPVPEAREDSTVVGEFRGDAFTLTGACVGELGVRDVVSKVGDASFFVVDHLDVPSTTGTDLLVVNTFDATTGSTAVERISWNITVGLQFDARGQKAVTGITEGRIEYSLLVLRFLEKFGKKQ